MIPVEVVEVVSAVVVVDVVVIVDLAVVARNIKYLKIRTDGSLHAPLKY